jgi:hypothetical protein
MAVLVVGSEKNFAAVRARVATGTVSSAAAKRIAEAFRQANPGVDLDKLQPGTVLAVPDLPELKARGDLALDDGVERAADAVLAQANQILDGLVETASTLRKEAAAERRQVAKAMDGREVREAAEQIPGLGEDIEAARRALEEDEATDKERAAALKKAQARWAPELTAFRELLR